MSKRKLQVVVDGTNGSDGSDDVLVGRLRQLYADAQAGLRRVVAFGLYAWEIKETHVKHGQFQEWLIDHCPELSLRSVKAYMQLTQGVLDQCGFQMGSALPICRGGQLLLAEPNELPEDARALRDQICGIIDGKSARQLMLQFKTVSEGADGMLHVEQGGGDAVWRKWAWKHHPELFARPGLPPGTVPSRKDAPKAVQREFDKWMAEKLAATVTPEARRKMADKAVADLEREIRGLTGSTWILQASREALMRLGEAAKIISSRCSELTRK